MEAEKRFTIFSESPDQMEVLAVNTIDGVQFVTVKSNSTYGDDEDCIVVFERSDYEDLIVEFLDWKMKYCDGRGHWCGVAHITSVCEGLPPMEWFDYNDEFERENERMIKVYLALSTYLEMEHG